MGRIDDYLQKQRKIISDAKSNYEVGMRVQYNLAKLYFYSDDQLRIHSSNDRNNSTNPIEGISSLDFVYRKISKAVSLARKFDPNGIAGIITDHVNDLQIKLEERRMGREEYRYLQNTSTKDLVAEWSNEILSRLGKVA